MDRIECLSAFVHVLESGSFSAAARRLNTSQPTISKRISLLETELGASLFLRSTRSLSPTEEAMRVYDKARSIIEMFDQAKASARHVTQQPTGTLTISVPSSVGRNLLMPLIADFRHKFPEVILDIRSSEQHVNLVEEGVELALRMGELKDSTLRARPLGRYRRYAVASPNYLKNCSPPETPEELKNHLCIEYSGFGSSSEWVFEGENGRHVVKVDSVIKLDDADTMLSAVLEGIGIAILPVWLVSSHVSAGKLEIILPEDTIPSIPMHAVYPETGFLSLRARTFLDFLVDQRQQINPSHQILSPS